MGVNSVLNWIGLQILRAISRIKGFLNVENRFQNCIGGSIKRMKKFKIGIEGPLRNQELDNISTNFEILYSECRFFSKWI
jgi:hypothetical protein